MLTLTCKIKFADGATVSGQIVTPSPETEMPVFYAGAVDRLVKQFPKSDAAFLEFIFKKESKRSGGALTVTRDGEFDRFAV